MGPDARHGIPSPVGVVRRLAGAFHARPVPLACIVLLSLFASHARSARPIDDFRAAAPESQMIASDDFDQSTLDTTVWRFDDPVGDVLLWMTGTNAIVYIPGGTNHDLRTTGIRAPRFMQPAPDGDFDVEGKFDSQGAYYYQGHGIMAADNDDTYIRFQVIFGEGSPRVYAAYEYNGTRYAIFDQVLASAPPYLRMARTGNQWSCMYSYDGAGWTTAGTFAQPMTLNEMGVFFYAAPNSADEMWWTPAFVGNIDYFFNRSAPIAPEDGGQPTASTPPVIEVWGGNEQYFGHLGVPQRWFNIVGRVWDTETVQSLSYRLNGGASFPLSMGPNLTRLIGIGDYNIEIDYAELLAGDNEVVITAIDVLGETREEVVTVDYTPGIAWPLPDTVDFEAATRLSDAAHVVDGRWRLIPGEGVRVDSTAVGYDRLLVLGDRAWTTDYEVLVPFTVHAASAVWLTGVGVGLGWQGHTGSDQPRLGHPYQALVWVTGFAGDQELVIEQPGIPEATAYPDLEANVRYFMRVRSRALGNGESRVSARLWADGAPEPTIWQLSADLPTRDGSVFLVAHRVEATFGNVSIAPVPPLVTAIGDPEDVPRAPAIRGVYPNPFVTHTVVEYGIPERADVRVAVYDAAGRLVHDELMPGVPGGWHTYVFRGADVRERVLPSGVYFCRIDTPAGSAARKIVILR